VQLCPDGVHLNLFDFRTGKRLPTPKETNRLWQEAAAEVARLQKWADSEIASVQERVQHTERLRQEQQNRADEAERQRQEQQKRADDAEFHRQLEQQRADEAERRLAELKAELARLRPEPPTNGHATSE
jgi:chromosome segregation ATPase